jgi:hypothetical protein
VSVGSEAIDAEVASSVRSVKVWLQWSKERRWRWHARLRWRRRDASASVTTAASEVWFQICSTWRCFPFTGDDGGSCMAFELGERGRGTSERRGGGVVWEAIKVTVAHEEGNE